MSYILTLSDRTVIQTLLKVGYSQKQIAEEVGVAPSTINYELKRYPKGYYDADQAQEDYEKKLTHRGRKTLLTEHLREFVRGIILGSSPKCWCKLNSANLSFHKLKHTGFF